MEQEYSEENQQEYEKLIRDELARQQEAEAEESQNEGETQGTPTTNTTEVGGQPQTQNQTT